MKVLIAVLVFATFLGVRAAGRQRAPRRWPLVIVCFVIAFAFLQHGLV